MAPRVPTGIDSIEKTLQTRVVSFGQPGTARRVGIGYTIGDPNGQWIDEVGALRMEIGVPRLWQKQTGGYSATGWVVVAGTSALLPDLFYLNVADLGAVPGSSDATPGIQATMTAASLLGGKGYIWIPPGSYTLFSTPQQPANTIVFGAGPNTILHMAAGVSGWDFPNGFVRAELGYLQILADPVAPGAIGIDLDQSQRVLLHDLQVWDFMIGIRLSSGVPFTAYNTIGPDVEINRCDTGLFARANSNANRIVSSRIFFSYTLANTGVGIDIEDAQGLEIDNVQIEAADTCIRVRNTNGLLHLHVHDCYLEPGSNPDTGQLGSLYDVDIANLFDGTEEFYFRNNVPSGSLGNVVMPTEMLGEFDGFSRAFFGARFSGQATPKRNWIYNGEVLYYGLPSVLPGWGVSGVPPTLSSNPLHVTGVRSLQADANANTSTVSVGFTVSDDGVQWVTCGVRVQVLAGNVGFFFSGVVGANARQFVPETSIAGDGLWHEFFVNVPVDPNNKNGAVSFTVDAVNGTGSILIDEAWAVPGKYAIPSTQMAHRLQFLPAPIPIVVRTGVVANETYGPVDLLTLPSTLAPPLDAMATAPTGTIGAILRLQLTCTGAPAGLMANQHWVYVDVPASGAVIPASFDFAAWAVYSNQPVTGECTIFDTTISGGYNAGDGFSSDYTVYLVAWVIA
jgi:hypothetical protein